jgi:hypothetical protein
MLLFWDADPDDGFDAGVKLVFDETITEHLDSEYFNLTGVQIWIIL